MPRRPIYRILLVSSLAAIGVVAGLLVWVRREAAHRWEMMIRQNEALIADAEKRSAQRAPLGGAATPGNAWKDYARALLASEGLSPEEGRLLDAVQGQAALGATSPEWSRLLSRMAPALGDLRAGARREESRLPLRWDPKDPMPAGAEAVKRLAALGLCVARLEAHREGPARGVAGVLDVCQFAADFGRNSFHERLDHSMEYVELGLTGVRDLLLSPGWSREDLGRLESSLEAFDRNFPSEAEVSLNELARFMKSLLSETTLDQMGWAGWEWYRQWKYGFSRRLRLAVELSDMERVGQELAPALDRPWGERQKTFAAFTPDSTMTGALVQIVFGRFGTVDGNRARLNLLRTAVHYLRTEEILELEDPYGKALHARKEGKRLILWSNGWSVLDSEGVGGWTTSEIASSTKGHNIILEVGR